MKYNFRDRELSRILNVLEDLKDSASVRANTIISPVYPNETERMAELRMAKAEATASAYAFCQRLLIDSEL